MTQDSVNSSAYFLQFVSTSTGSASNISSIIPYDNTIPQNTEGTEIISLSITPKLSTSRLEVSFSGTIEKVGSGNVTVALFKDTTTNALAAQSFLSSDTFGLLGTLQYIMTSGTTSPITFKIRIGPSSNSVDINSDSLASGAGRVFGGVSSTILMIKETL